MPGKTTGVGVEEDKLYLAYTQADWTVLMQKLRTSQMSPIVLDINVPTRSDECELATQQSMDSSLELQSTPTTLRFTDGNQDQQTAFIQPR